MVKRAMVLHGEFPLEGKYGVLQEHCARCGEHNVINIKQQIYCIVTTWKMNKEVSDLASTSPKVRRYVANQLHQAQGAFFSP
jgi:hypothetical protein